MPRKFPELSKSLIRYLGEDGTRNYAACFVPDLLPTNGEKVELLFVLESPHKDEMVLHHPLCGAAGKRALKFLDPNLPDSLGEYVSRQQSNGDFRIGLMNVCNVPLQEGAFVKNAVPKPDFQSCEWNELENERKSKRVSNPCSLIQVNLERRIVNAVDKHTVVAVCGRFAQRYVMQVPTIILPHPSRNGWQRAINSNLRFVRERFLLAH